jgi:hypothetical protein
MFMTVNKIDAAMEVTEKSFSFLRKYEMLLYLSRVRMGDTQDLIDQVLGELEVDLSIREN